MISYNKLNTKEYLELLSLPRTIFETKSADLFTNHRE